MRRRKEIERKPKVGYRISKFRLHWFFEKATRPVVVETSILGGFLENPMLGGNIIIMKRSVTTAIPKEYLSSISFLSVGIKTPLKEEVFNYCSEIASKVCRVFEEKPAPSIFCNLALTWISVELFLDLAANCFR